MLCLFCRYLCQEALQQAEKLDQSDLPLDKQYRRIEHVPAHNAEELLHGVHNDCYMCLRFWTLASQDYRDGVEGGLLYPPKNQYKTVSSFHIHILLDLESVRDQQEHRRIWIYLYHSKVEYRTAFQSYLHSEDVQQFAVLLSSGMFALILLV
jgi:hypothetical protein